MLTDRQEYLIGRFISYIGKVSLLAFAFLIYLTFITNADIFHPLVIFLSWVGMVIVMTTFFWQLFRILEITIIWRDRNA